MQESALLVYVSCPPSSAESLGTALIGARVAACVSIIPTLHSLYHWQGQLQRTEESLLLIKTTMSRFEALKECVVLHHPYELPEIVGVPCSEVHLPYLQWLVEAVRPSSGTA